MATYRSRIKTSNSPGEGRTGSLATPGIALHHRKEISMYETKEGGGICVGIAVSGFFCMKYIKIIKITNKLNVELLK